MTMRLGILMIFLLIGCASRQDPLEAPVASWNGIEVSKSQFVTEYRLYGTYSPILDDEQTRIEYAHIMLERQIIAEKAREAKLDTMRIVRETVRRRKQLASRAHLFNTVVKPDVPLATESELREAFRRANTQMFTQQIYAPDAATADSLYALLQQGADFTELAQRAMGFDGTMGWVGFDMMDEAPEAVLFSMKQGEVSKPVQSLVGWHIFKAHEVEETVFFDEGTFNNQRESLRFTIDQRRFDEASALYQRSVVMTHELATDIRALEAVYAQLDPLFPSDATPNELQRFNSELFFLQPRISPDTPLASVNGRPFTVRQFLYHLPDIPYTWVQSNPLEALQIAIRDSILSDVAEKTVRPDTARSVRTAVRVAESTALFYAGLQSAADTLSLEHHTGTWYERFKNSHFLTDRISTIETAVFRDNTSAMGAIQDYMNTKAWDPQTNIRTETIRQKASPEHPANRMRMSASTRITGPFKSREGWVVYELKDQRAEFRSYDDVRPELLALMNERRFQIAQEALLPANYRREDVIIDLSNLEYELPN